MSGADRLLEYLLDEVSLLGDSGATSDDFKKLVSKFYGLTQTATTEASDSIVDRPLLETVWRWLAACPEVSVGEDREGNSLSLSEFEEIERRQASNADAAADKDQPVDGQTTNSMGSGPMRLSTSIIRKWQTVTGHAPDIALVAPAEFQALCLIAAAGESGILQTELVKLSGQDKRSLPKRTDKLADCGYIEKRPYYIKNMKTSLLRHRKFFRSTKDGSYRGTLPTTSDIFGPDGFDFDNFMTLLVNLLDSEGPATLVSVHDSLGIDRGTTWQFRCVRRGLEKLEATGIISRFSARRKERTNNSQNYYIRCLKLNRMPTDEDRRTAHAISRAQLDEFRLRLEKEYNEAHLDDGDADRPQVDSQISLQDGDVPETEPLTQASKPVASSFFDPEEPYPSFLFRAVQSYGVKGVSTVDLREALFGPLFTRPVESMLNKLSDASLQTQPPSLRHRSIVRDSGIKERAMFYLYRTFDNFQKAVDLGETSWDSIGSVDISAVSKPKLDKWGFPEVAGGLLLAKDGSATLATCSASFREPQYKLGQIDPVAEREPGGTWSLSWNRKGGAVGRPREAPKRRKTPQAVAAEVPGEEPPEVDLPAPKGPEMIGGLTRKEYNRQYRLRQIEAQQRKQRIPQLTRYATWLAGKEAAEGLHDTRDAEMGPPDPDQQGGQSTVAPTNQKSIPKRRAEELSIGANPKRQKVSHLEKQRSVEVIQGSEPEARPSGTGDQTPEQQQGLKASRDRVSELIEYLQDTTKPGVHVNPVGSTNYLPRGRRAKGRQILIVSFRFDWLSNFDWFTSSAPTRPPPAEATGKGNETEAREDENDAAPESVTAENHTHPRTDRLPSAKRTPRREKRHDATPESAAAKDRNQKRKGRQPNFNRAQRHGNIASLRGMELDEPEAHEERLPPEGHNSPRTPRKAFVSPATLETQEKSNLPVAENGVVLSSPVNAELGEESDGHSNPNQPSPVREQGANNVQSTPEMRKDPEIGLLGTPQPAISKTSSPVLLSNGSVRFRRTKLLLDIVDKCNGILGADKETIIAFQNEQKKRNEQVADRYTIMRATKNLVDQGKLQRVVVVFNDKKGRAVSKPLLLRPDVSINSPAATDMIKKIEECHPLLYIPLDIPQDPKPAKKAISRYIRRDDTLTVETPATNTRAEAVAPWEADFYSKKRLLADRRNERFESLKLARLGNEALGEEGIPEPLSSETPMQRFAGSRNDDSRNDRKYTFVIMGLSERHITAPVKRPNAYYVEPPRKRLRRTGEFLEFHAVERKKFLTRQAQHQQSLLAPRHVFFPHSGTYATTFSVTKGRYTPFKPASQYYRLPIRPEPIRTVEDDLDDEAEDGVESPPQTGAQGTPESSILDGEGPDAGNRPTISRILDPKCVITPKAAKMLLYACVAIRTLAGGKDRSMNWSIIDQVFAGYPNYAQHNFRTRWVWMLKTHGNLVNKLQAEFEDLFLEAYDAGELPIFRLHLPERYQWDALIEWMEENIDVLAEKGSLPADRTKFDARCILHATPTDTPASRERYFLTSNSSIKRHQFSNSITLALPSPLQDHSGYPHDQQVARSWLRAAVLADKTVDPVTYVRLNTLDEAVRQKAVQSLLDEKIIAKSRPGRSKRFQVKAEPDAFKKRRLLSARDFADAAGFKARLDAVAAAASSDEEPRGLAVDMGVRTGEMLAATELAAGGRVRVTGRLPPVDSTIGAPWPRLSVWGFSEGRYEGKKADKRKFLWPVDVVPAEGYVAGQPLGGAVAAVPVPRWPAGDEAGRERVPYWVDLQGRFLEGRWRELLMLLLSTLSLRAGSTVRGLVESSGKFLAPWEVELALDWLVEVGAAARTGTAGNGRESGFVTREWWWTILCEDQKFEATS